MGRISGKLNLRSSDAKAVAALLAIAFQLVIGTYVAHLQAQPTTLYKSPTIVQQVPPNFEASLAITGERLQQDREQIAELRTQVAAAREAFASLERRVAMIEHVSETTNQILKLSYGIIVSILGVIGTALGYLRSQKRRRNESQERSEEMLRGILEEYLKR